MSLATRCTACGTIFRVVQDQLRVSEGWVRCGRCAEVFDAGEQLFDIDRDAPPPWPTGSAVVHLDRDEPTQPTSPQPAPHVDPDVEAASDSGSASTDDDLRREPQWIADPAPLAPAHGELELNGQAPLARDIPAEFVAVPGPELPSFMRTRAPRSTWDGAPVRVALSIAIGLMVALLGLQLTLHFRDAVAAVYPQSRPTLLALCRASGCSVNAWRRIDAVSVESSALTQSGRASAANQYKLTVSLHNKSGVAVATPAIELTLLDGVGTVVLRRVLLPSAFQSGSRAAAPPSEFPAGADVALDTLVATGTQAVSGYSVEVFYP